MITKCTEKDCKNEPHDESGLCAYHRIIGGNGKVKETVTNPLKTEQFTIQIEPADYMAINMDFDGDAWNTIYNRIISIQCEVDEDGNITVLAAS